MTTQNLKLNPFGIVSLEPEGEFIAGTYASFTLTYTAGIYGMDDLGGLKIFFRFACDQSPLQMENPKEVGYTTASASNGADVVLSYELREGERPWYKMLRVRIAGKGLKAGETIKIQLGDSLYGSPGLRLQTFCEPTFEFRTVVDVFSTNVFIPLSSPKISLVSGSPIKWKAFFPTLQGVNEEFSLQIRAEDRWGNPSDKMECILTLKPSHEIIGLPAIYKITKGKRSHKITGLKIKNLNLNKISFNESIIFIDLYDEDSNYLTRTNPLILKDNPSIKHYWGDMHGQSEETIGSNSAEMYFEFARDVAFLDVIGHQGNDFQITKKLWKLFNDLSEKYNEKDTFVTLFGYEYSANTALGGDRNVYFLNPYCQIHRSSHALIQQENDQDTDCLTASDLFKALRSDHPDADETVLVIAHVGGRYADILNHHDGRIENSVEIHSAWGTFEWLLFDAFERGYRMGIVANSDDHKGRPGVAYPGASKFGTYGGLTCFLCSELSREEIFNALKHRHHYATTGERIFLEIEGKLSHECKYYEKDPSIFPNNLESSKPCVMAQMGDIIGVPNDIKVNLALYVSIAAASPIERIEIFNGKDLTTTIRPYLYSSKELEEELIKVNQNDPKVNPDVLNKYPTQIRIRWEGAEFRARKRNATWKGTVEFEDNRILSAQSFNFWNQDAPLQQKSDNILFWDTITSGNFQGFDVNLLDPFEGKLDFQSSQINFQLPINNISVEDTIFEAGGVDKRVRVYRYSRENPQTSFTFQIDIPLVPTPNQDDRIFVKITLENGHQAWSSPVYFITDQ
ncbi:MAG: DUF3604 domain-containing protein [Candidatus Hermodarchaeota archaeon]